MSVRLEAVASTRGVPRSKTGRGWASVSVSLHTRSSQTGPVWTEPLWPRWGKDDDPKEPRLVMMVMMVLAH